MYGSEKLGDIAIRDKPFYGYTNSQAEINIPKSYYLLV